MYSFQPARSQRSRLRIGWTFFGAVMRRRDVITLLGSIAAARVIPARAQQGGRLRRIGILMGVSESDPEGARYLGVFQEALRASGWRDRQDIQIHYRAAADLEGMRS